MILIWGVVEDLFVWIFIIFGFSFFVIFFRLYLLNMFNLKIDFLVLLNFGLVVMILLLLLVI